MAKNRKLLPELLGMALYRTKCGEYFYAWSANHAIKKRPGKKLFIITKFGKAVYVETT